MWQLLPAGDCGYRGLIAAAAKPLPNSLRAIQDSFGNPMGHNLALGLFIIAASTAVLVTAAWYFSRGEPKPVKEEKDDSPEKLFDEMLGAIHLSESDKRLLRQMAGQGRLKHPAMCLLSPGMLEWAHELWVQEKGSEYVTEARTAQVREIAVKLYGHHGGGETVIS